MRKRKPKFLLAFAVAIITFGSLKAFVPTEFQEYNHCRQTEHCGGNFENRHHGTHFSHKNENRNATNNNSNQEKLDVQKL